MTKADVCAIVDGLWVSRPVREALKYKVRSYAYSPDELDNIGKSYQVAVDEQLGLIQDHAAQAIESPEVVQLQGQYHGAELFRQRKVVAARVLRERVLKKHRIKIPADLSREVLEKHLTPARSA